MFATLRRSGGIEALVRRSGYSPASVSAASEALIPELLACLRIFVENEGGEEVGVKSLLGVLEELGGGRLAAEIMGHEAISLEPADAIFEQICDNRAIGRPIPGAIAEQSGVDQDVVENILPLLAMLMCGYVAARAGGSGDGDGLHWALDLLVKDRKI
ncbi:MAG: hypothetical protein H6917_10400 [Novosphingobium sp.]|nr:hypothetical protein [Novosphingobium sp.]MCP5402782.1 hypothetical protein [Novosphingobium sp.]